MTSLKVYPYNRIEGKKIYFHSGGDTGYGSFAGLCPSANIAVVLMDNNDSFDRAELGFNTSGLC